MNTPNEEVAELRTRAKRALEQGNKLLAQTLDARAKKLDAVFQAAAQSWQNQK